jgi:hypothetical protein
MAGIRRIHIIICIACLLALSALVAMYFVWIGLGIRSHPWHLEAYLESAIASSSIEPGIYNFRSELESLAVQTAEARQCLADTDGKWTPLRDYSNCMPQLLSSCFKAQLLELKVAERRQSEKTKLAVMLASLQRELKQGSEGRKVWSSFDSRNINKKRANSLVQQAQTLEAEGQFESALKLTFLASSEFQKFNDQSGRVLARFEDARSHRIWDQQALELRQWSRKNGKRAVLVDKLQHLCVVINKGKIEKSYPANLGRNWYQQKAKEHDSSTPEGEYKVKRMNSSGKYGFALLLDYPTAVDRARFRDLKRAGAIPSDARIGGNLEIHGGGRLSSDWTEGCISLKDEDMRDLYRHSYLGMPVTIVGTCRLVSSMLQDP